MVKGKAWFRIKDPPAGEGQVGQSQTHLKDHLIVFFLLPFYPFTFLSLRVDLPYSCSIKNKYLVFFSSTTGLSPCSLWYPCATFSSYGLSWFIASRYSHGANHSCCSLIRLSRVRAIVKADKTVAIRSTEYR